MKDCIFCKIVKGEIPSHKIYEDDLFFGFLDIRPRTKGHSLLIPKKHYRWVYDVAEFKMYWEAVLKITKAMQRAIQPKFVSYVTHGLEVPHAHIHIMPRKSETAFVPPEIKIDNEEMKKIASEIRSSLKL